MCAWIYRTELREDQSLATDCHSLKFRPKGDDLELATSWKGLQKKLEGLSSHLNSLTIHRATSVYDKHKANFVIETLFDLLLFKVIFVIREEDFRFVIG